MPRKPRSRVLLALLLAAGLTACAARAPAASSSATARPPKAESPSSSEAAPSSEAPGEEREDAFYQEILRSFGADSTESNPSAPAPLVTSVLSFFYLDDRPDLSALDPGDYLSWYLATGGQVEEGGLIPQEGYEALAARYFGVTADKLRAAVCYRADLGGYQLDGGPGIGMRPFILLDRAEPDGDLLRLYVTLIPPRQLLGFEKEYKILTVRPGEGGAFQYVSYMTDPEPSEAQKASGKWDNTQVKTGFPATYRNEELGLSFELPESWADHYTDQVSDLWFDESETVVGRMVQFLYAGDPNGVLAMVSCVPLEIWPRVQLREEPIGVYIGEDERYAFVVSDGFPCRYPDGPDAELFNSLQMPAEEFAAHAVSPTA